MDLFTAAQLQTIGITAVITTVIVSAIQIIMGSSKVHGNWVLLIVSTLVTLLQVTFVKGMSINQWQDFFTSILLNTAFAVLFYQYLGQFFVDKLFVYLKKLIGDKFGSSTPPQLPNDNSASGDK